MRRATKGKHTLLPDPVYNSEKVTRLINYIMRRGKKDLARRIVYRMFDRIREVTKTENPVEVFEAAIRNAAPLVEVRSRRVGGVNYQVPVEVRTDRRLALAIRWLIGAAKGKEKSAMGVRLADEIIAASKNEGEAVKRRENVHKMAEANKAFAHFAW